MSNSPLRFGVAQFFVEDVEQALIWYERAFGLTRKFIHPTGRYGELATGETSLAFASFEVAGMIGVSVRRSRLDEEAPPAEVIFVTDDAEVAYARAVASGAHAVRPPERMPWGQVVGYVRDFQGVLVEIGEPHVE